MIIRLTRESVCAADDCDAPHPKTITVPNTMTVGDLVKLIQKDYVPRNIQGGKATWSVVSSVPIAVLAQQWSDPKLLPLITMLDGGVDILTDPEGNLKLHVNYHAQIDPEIVLEVLKGLKLKNPTNGCSRC
jgi:hypothetical protein